MGKTTKQRRASRKRAKARSVVSPRGTLTLASGWYSFAITVGADDEPPTEFQIFTAGWNDSEHGRVLFDDKAAKMTMAAFERHGVDRMIDLEHLSLDQESRSFDPDARGWTKLELRQDGSLWAVDVKWTEDGDARLRSKRQRFISPTFFFDEDGRVTKILNIALTALPATHGTPELVAARVKTKGAQRNNMLTPEQATAAVEAVKAEDGAAALELLNALIAGMLAGEEATPPPAEGEGEGEGDPPAELVEDDEELKAKAKAKANSEATETANELAAACSRLMRLTNTKTLGQAVEQAAVHQESHMTLAEGTAKLKKERGALELKERKALAVKMTELGVEFPSTTGLNEGKLCKRLLDEPLQELRDRVAKLTAAKATTTSSGGSDGASGGNAGIVSVEDGGGDTIVKNKDNPYGLTQSQLGYCAQYKCDPKMYAHLSGQKVN